MTEPLVGKTLEALTNLVHRSMSALGAGDVQFVIRAQPLEVLNWCIDFAQPAAVSEEQQRALNGVIRQLRERYFLLFPSPYAA
jgi:hypothetical protein